MTKKETADIVERLRNDDVVWGVRPSLAFEAADEIERLREALQKIDELKPDEEFGAVPIETAQRIASEALKWKE
jgi:hypothetical protein